MATKLKKFSHSTFMKVIVFIILIASVIGGIFSGMQLLKVTDRDLEIIFEKSYLESSAFQSSYNNKLYQLAELIGTYKSEENILAGKTVNKDELSHRVEEYYWENDDVAIAEATIEEKSKQAIIDEDVKSFHRILRELAKEKEPLYYLTDGEHTFTNTKETKKTQFEKYPVYYIGDGYEWEVHPASVEKNYRLYNSSHLEEVIGEAEAILYAGYSANYLDAISADWERQKEQAIQCFYYLLGFLGLFIFSLLYLVITTGRRTFQDKTAHMQSLDKLYVDLNIVILLCLIMLWFIIFNEVMPYIDIDEFFIYFTTILYVIISVILCLSLVRHLKNKTFIKHSIIYIVLRWAFSLLKDIYNSGSVGMKITLIVIVYPIITAATVFFFPITIGVAVWLALRKVKDFNQIQAGTKKMRDGDLKHRIMVDGKGEFATLAANINSIHEGFEQAVHNELQNERMKTELITNVSHDIRTPLTSFITYTDLLKTERDPEKIKTYIDILDQKSKRLQTLTDDLFAAAKASSGDIPVQLQTIDLIALLNQGIGEVSEQIEEKQLSFITNYQAEKISVIADGKLLWRSVENILTNIFNYALEGSRVYIDVTSEGNQVCISFKNISKYELNISEAELMERFKRGDESRTSKGSGLGLSITRSLIENQGGAFSIKIDGDLFKSEIYLNKEKE